MLGQRMMMKDDDVLLLKPSLDPAATLTQGEGQTYLSVFSLYHIASSVKFMRFKKLKSPLQVLQQYSERRSIHTMLSCLQMDKPLISRTWRLQKQLLEAWRGACSNYHWNHQQKNVFQIPGHLSLKYLVENLGVILVGLQL